MEADESDKKSNLWSPLFTMWLDMLSKRSSISFSRVWNTCFIFEVLDF